MPKKQSKSADPGGARPTVQQLLNEEADGTLEGFIFDPAVCKRAFEHYDKDGSGFLDEKELMKLADKLWDTFIPEGPKLSEAEKKQLVREIKKKTDFDGDEKIDYEEFLPWFKSMNEKFYRITHPKILDQTAVDQIPSKSVDSTITADQFRTTATKSDVSKIENFASERERLTPQRDRERERSGPPPSSSPPPPPAEDPMYKSYSPPSIRYSALSMRGPSSEVTLDLDVLKAKIAELRNSVQGFASALDKRLDICLQSVRMQSSDFGEESTGVV